MFDGKFAIFSHQSKPKPPAGGGVWDGKELCLQLLSREQLHFGRPVLEAPRLSMWTDQVTNMIYDSQNDMSIHIYIYIWLDLSLVRECFPVICSCSLRFQRFVQHQVLPLAVCGSCGAGRECRGLQGDARRDHGGSRGWPPWYHDIRCWKRITMGGFSIV